jgi:hypothetical protein
MGGIDPALCDENTGALDANHRLLNTLVEPKRSQSAHEPANHNRYGYIFSVDGRSYTGWESPRKDELEIGKQVVVYYDPNDPAKNALTDFGELSIEKFGPIPTLMFGIGGVALVFSGPNAECWRLRNFRTANPRRVLTSKPDSCPISRRNIKGRPFWSRVLSVRLNPPRKDTLYD